MKKVTAETAPFVPVTLAPWEYTHAATVAADRIARNQLNERWADTRKVGPGEHPLVTQTAAVCAEVAVAKALNQYPTAVGAWDAGRHGEFWELPDVGHTLDVKRVRHGGSTSFNFGRKDLEANRTLAVAYVEPQLWNVRVLGWISAHEARDNGWVGKDGSYVSGPIWALKLGGGVIDELDVVKPGERSDGEETEAEHADAG